MIGRCLHSVRELRKTDLGPRRTIHFLCESTEKNNSREKCTDVWMNHTEAKKCVRAFRLVPFAPAEERMYSPPFKWHGVRRNNWENTLSLAALQIDSKLINHSSFQLLSGLGFYLMEKKGEQVGWILLRLKLLIKWDWWREKEGEETRGRSEAKPLRRISQVGPAKLSEGW